MNQDSLLDSFKKPDSYSPIPNPFEEEDNGEVMGDQFVFGGSDSDNFKRSPPYKIEEVKASNPLAFSQRLPKQKTGATPRGTPRSNMFLRESWLSQMKKKDEFLLEFTRWMRCQIISYHLIEPVLVAFLVGTCLNMPQLNCLCVIIVSMGLYLPLLLSGVPRRIQVKIVASMLLLGFLFLYSIFKLVIFFMEYPRFVGDAYLSTFLGIFFGQWQETFIIDMVLIVLMGVLLWHQTSQLQQCKSGIELGEKKISKQFNVKFLHPIFGESLFVFYTIAYLVFLLNTFFYQSFVQLAILTCQLIQCYMWTIKVEVSTRAYKKTLRVMQIVCFLTLIVGYVFMMPYVFNAFLSNPENGRLIELLGYIQLTTIPNWYWRLNIILLSCAIVLSEVFFVADEIFTKQQRMKVPVKVEGEGSLLRRHLVNGLKIKVESNKKANLWFQLEKLWQITKSPLTLWTARLCCFVWAYLFHDYQSLIVLIWMIHSTLYVKSTTFVKCTAYFYLPIFNLLFLWYFATNVFGLINFGGFSQPQTLLWYKYGLYDMQMPPLLLSFMSFILFVISYYCRQNFEKHEVGQKTHLIIDDLSKNKSTMWQIIYLVVLYLEYPLFLALVTTGMAKMDFYHVFLLFIFVAYTLFPKFISKNSICILIYADFFVLTKYVWSLLVTTNQQQGWPYIIGISSNYDPQSTQEYFRYHPYFDEWLLVLIAFTLYRRSNLVGTDYAKIKEKELECIKDLYYKSPRTKKIFTTIDILINHCVIIFTFLVFMFILVFMRRSFLNLISIMLMLIEICAYMSKGIKKLNFFWNIFTFYQAFVLLSILVYQFIYQSGISEMQWFVDQTDGISDYVAALLYWTGYYKFPDPIWYHFFPYVILFSFAVSIRHRFRLKQEMENQEIVLPDPDDNLLYSNSNSEENAELRLSNSVTSSYVSGLYSSTLTRLEAEKQLTGYQIQLQENYFKMLYQIQYPVWKSKAIWPLLTWFSRYHNFFLCVAIFCISLYYQIALIWLIFLIIYLMQAWSVSNLHNKFMVEQFDQFMANRPPSRSSTKAFKQQEQGRSRSNSLFSEQEQSINTQDQKKKDRLLITDQEVIKEYENFNLNVHKTSLQSRHVFWLTQFWLVTVSIFFVYLSDFVTTTFVDPSSGKSITLIQNEDIQNKTLFLYFWFGFLRQVPKNYQALDDTTGLIQVYYPFFVLVLMLISEKLSQMWLIDKFGITDEVVSKWEKLELRYKEIFNQEDLKSQMSSIKEETKSSSSKDRVQRHFIEPKRINFTPRADLERRQTFQIKQSWVEEDPPLAAPFRNTALNNSVASQILGDDDAIRDDSSTKSVLLIEAEQSEIGESESVYGSKSKVNRISVFDSFDEKSKATIEEIKGILKPMLTVKSKVVLNKTLKICFEEFIILLLWFSCIYKQSVFSFVIFFVLLYHTAHRNQRNSDKPMLLVRYTVVFILVCEYLMFLTNLTSYNSPTPFPEALTPAVTVDGVVLTSPYPSWNTTTDSGIYYFYLPWYFAIPSAAKWSPPTVNVDLITYCSVFVSKDQQNGMWFDFIITLLVVFYLDSCNFFILTKKIKVVSSEECDEQIKKYQQIMKYQKKETKEVKKELSIMIAQNRFVDYWANWLYQDFILVMIAFVIIISIYSRTLLSYGYFLFCMILIFQSRKFFVRQDSHKVQRNFLRRFLLPYLLLDIFLQLIYQLPIKIFEENSKWASIVGFETYWKSTPEFLYLGYIGEVSTVLENPLTSLYLKGVAYLCIMIQLAIIESRGFKNFKKKFTDENLENRDLIGKGIAYRFNNFKSKKILKQAKSFSELQKMLLDVKALLKRRDKMFKAQQQLMTTGQMPKKDLLSVIDEDVIKQPKYRDLKTEFEIEVKHLIEERIKKLNVFEKLYLWLRRNFVQDILFKRSKNHLIEIVECFKNGRTCETSNLERGVRIQVKLEVLKKFEDEVSQDKEDRMQRLQELRLEISEEAYARAEKAELEKIDQLKLEFLQFRNKQLSSMQLKPWQKIDMENFQSWKTLCCNYLYMVYKIVASYTEWICYVFMLSATYSNGGLLYMVYPILIFGYALLEESKPGSRFWYFTIIYTQVIIMVQFTVQLTIWSYFWTEQTTQMYDWTLKCNLGLVYLPVFTFENCLQQFLPEILIVMSVLVHIQGETMEGVFDKPPYIFESFEDGLMRYRLNINKDLTQTYDELQKLFEHQAVIKNNLDYELKPRSRSFDDQREGHEEEQSDDLFLRSRNQIFDNLHIPAPRSKSMDHMFELKAEEKQTTIDQLKQSMTVLWDNNFFKRLFPEIKQQKPGKDYYVWTTFISFILCLYIILFFTQMSGQKTTLADQYNSNQFQSYMVITLFVMITIMVIDRIFYGSHAQLTKNDKPAEIVQDKPQEPPTNNQLAKSERSLSFENKLNASQPFQRSRTAVHRSVTSEADARSEFQLPDELNASVYQSQKSEQEIIDEEEEVLKMKAYEEALTPVLRQKNWKRIVKVYYFWLVILLVHWYVFFSMPNQQKYCTEVQQRAYCNKFRNNKALIVFYSLFVVYFILQAFQLQQGMPELRKGGFMVDQYDTVSKTIFTVWYYIPFLFELRSVIDWTFSETALDIFQWLKLAQVQANLYLSKCVQRGYREKELGKKIQVQDKIGLGCGLMLLILTLIAGPMLLFSNINPVSAGNNVTGGTMVFTLNIENTLQNTNYNVALFQTSQVTSLTNLTTTQFDNLGFQNHSTTTAVFYADQVQALEFAESSDTVWIVSQPTRSMILEALLQVQSETPGLSITAQLTSTFERPSGSVKYTQSLGLTNQTQPEIIATLINQISCASASPISNQFPENMVCITVNAGTTASELQQPTYVSGFNLIYTCSSTNAASNFWGLSQTFDTAGIEPSVLSEYQKLFPDNGFGFFTFSQNTLPKALSAYSSSILLFYGTIVYVVASALRSGIVPFSYQIFITDAPLTEDILMICTSIHIYRMQRNLEQEEELYFILIDIMRSPEMIKELSKSSLKGPKQPPDKKQIKSQ